MNFSVLFAYNADDFWNSSLTWNTDEPKLTKTFGQLALTAFPNLFFLFLILFEVKFITESKYKKIRLNRYNAVRYLVSSCAVFFNLNLTFSYLHEPKSTANDFVFSISNLIIFATLTIIFHYHRLRGIITSGIIFTITFLLSIFTGILFLDTVLYNGPMYHEFEKNSILRNFLCSFGLFALSFIADNAEDAGIKQYLKSGAAEISPREFSSFISKVTYFYFTKVIKSTCEEEIKTENIFELPENIKVKKVTTAFNEIYYKEVDRIKQLNNKKLGDKKIKFNWISLLKVMWLTSWHQILIFFFIDLLITLLIYPKPIILDWLITFISSENEPKWHSAFIVVLFVTILFFKVIIANEYNLIATALRFNLKTSCSNLVFHKAIKLSPTAKSKRSIGEIQNLFSTDSSRFSNFANYVIYISTSPVQFFIGFYLLYVKLGKAAICGVFFIIVNAVCQFYFNKYKRKYLKKESDVNDERIKLINETLASIKLIKLNGWEKAFEDKITNERNKQADLNRKTYRLQIISHVIFSSIAPLFFFIGTISIFIFFIDSKLTPQQVFFASSIFSVISYPVRGVQSFTSHLLKVKVSLDRLSDFLNEEESENYVTRNHDEKLAIKIKNKARFIWELNQNSTDDSTNEKKDEKSSNLKKVPFTLNDIELDVLKNSFTCVIGKVGAGKSSLLSAILGDMHLIENDHLGRKGEINISHEQDINYVAQQAWIQNASFKDNVLFGQSINQEQYESVIKACALEPDLKQLEAGDETEIGEKGINLSGGQKQRISLARACYSSLSKNNKNQIILLDDPLSAVDAHVGKHLCEHVLSSETGILKDTTRILVTNQLNQLSDLHVDNVVLLKNGRIELKCTYEQLMEMENLGKLEKYNLKLLQNKKTGKNEEPIIASENEFSYDENNNQDSKKLIKEEKIGKGGVSMKNYILFLKYFGFLNFGLLIALTILQNYFGFCAKTYLANWTENNLNTTNITNESKKRHLVVYTGLSLFEILSYILSSVFMAYGTINCIKLFHQTLLKKVLRSSLKFFETTPRGRLMSRFGEDIDSIDNSLPNSVQELSGYFLELISCLFILIFKQPNTLTFYIFIFYSYYLIMSSYNKFSREIKRYTSSFSSPVYSHLSETMSGLQTIKAFNKTNDFEDLLKSKYEISNRSSWFRSTGSCWLQSSLSIISNLILLIVTSNLISNKDTTSAGTVALIINYSIDMTRIFPTIIRYLSTFESNAVSIERITQFLTNEDEEDEWMKENYRPPSDWPKNGQIEFFDYSARYREGTNLVLKDLNFKIDGSDKIGVVGRTGAGKSTITLSLFRIIEPASGKIVIDNVDISKIGLHDLRSKLSIIPQDPVLFTGTIRFNLDPFGKYSDEEINESLKHAHLKDFVDSLENGIEHKIVEGGENLSVGQRQLVCLARALLKKSKILVLDEATASVDFTTDELVQKTIRSEFENCTMITIAHRLNTVLDSTKILVLEKGELKEYEQPQRLLEDPNSLFYALAAKANII